MSLERLEADANGELLSTFTRPWSDGTIGSTLAPLELLEKLAALVPLPRMHLVRYGGCLAPPSQLRRLITPTPRQRGVEAPEAGSPSPRWGWARLLKRVFACDLEPCPACGRGTLRLIATLTQADVLRTMLRHLKRAAEPPPLAEARVCQASFAWASPEPDSAFSHVPWGQVVAEVRPRRVPPAAYGEHERVRDVSPVRRRGVSGQGAVFDPTIGLSRGVFRVRVTGGHHAKSALKYLFAEGHEVIKQWLPQAEEWVVPQATHGLQCMNPSAVADGLADFLARHT